MTHTKRRERERDTGRGGEKERDTHRKRDSARQGKIRREVIAPITQRSRNIAVKQIFHYAAFAFSPPEPIEPA